MNEKDIRKTEPSENIDFKGAIEKRDEILVEEDNVNMQLFLYGDQYKALADRTILLEESGLSFDELIYESDATLNAYVDFPAHGSPTLTLSIESEELGYKDYEIELTKSERKTLRLEAEELLEKEYGTTFEMLYLEGRLGKQVEPLTFDEIADFDNIQDLTSITFATLNLSKEQLAELCDRAGTQLHEDTYSVAIVYCNQTAEIEVASKDSGIKTAPLTLAEQKDVIKSLEKTLGKELKSKSFLDDLKEEKNENKNKSAEKKDTNIKK